MFKIYILLKCRNFFTKRTIQIIRKVIYGDQNYSIICLPNGRLMCYMTQVEGGGVSHVWLSV